MILTYKTFKLLNNTFTRFLALSLRSAQLRCFETNGLTHNFVGYPCDSTWLAVNTLTPQAGPAIAVFPNPGKGIFQLRGLPELPVPYVMYSLQGSILQQGVLHQPAITLNQKGVYFLHLQIDGEVVVKRLVVL